MQRARRDGHEGRRWFSAPTKQNDGRAGGRPGVLEQRGKAVVSDRIGGRGGHGKLVRRDPGEGGPTWAQVAGSGGDGPRQTRAEPGGGGRGRRSSSRKWAHWPERRTTIEEKGSSVALLVQLCWRRGRHGGEATEGRWRNSLGRGLQGSNAAAGVVRA